MEKTDLVYSFVKDLNKISKKYGLYLSFNKCFIVKPNSEKESLKYQYNPLTLEVFVKKTEKEN